MRIPALLLLLITAAAPTWAQSPCAEPDSTAPWYRVMKAWSSEDSGRWSNDPLRQRLLTLAKEDQADRADFGTRWKDTAYSINLSRRDEQRAVALEHILDSVGFPGRDLVGARGADAAMLIAQHVGRLQPRVLAMAKALPAGQVSPEALALMDDRLRGAQGLPQLYGSQFNAGSGDSLFKLAPVENVAELETRRARMGLMPLRDYVCELEAMGMKVDRSTLPPSAKPTEAKPAGAGV